MDSIDTQILHINNRISSGPNILFDRSSSSELKPRSKMSQCERSRAETTDLRPRS